jgi:phosphoglycolate phosphatase-like HAD superfamily hydrolase
VSRRWIFLDLDGPVLDVSRRYHQVHRDVVLRHGGRPLEGEEYWDAKRNRVPEAEILARCGVSPETDTERLAEIEAPAYLALDRPWPWTGAVLEELARWGSLALVTLRNHPDRLTDQLAALDLARSFERIVAGRGDGTPEAKAALLRESGIGWGPGSVLVGDTEVDIASGKALGAAHGRPGLRHPRAPSPGALEPGRAAFRSPGRPRLAGTGLEPRGPPPRLRPRQIPGMAPPRRYRPQGDRRLARPVRGPLQNRSQETPQRADEVEGHRLAGDFPLR